MTNKRAPLKTALHKKAMLDAMEKSLCNVTVAAKSTGIDRSTHHTWMQEDHVYAASIAELKDVRLDRLESALHKLVEEGNVTAIIFALKCLGKKRGYVERHEITDAGDRGITFTLRLPDGSESELT